MLEINDIFSDYPLITFSVSTYQGYEYEVLLLRNRNRSEIRNRNYMDWRYLGLSSQRSPLIFWVHNKRRELIGMAAFIFRPYWVREHRLELGILGDISLDQKYRGTGLARKWFTFVNGHLRQNTISALVIPNSLAGKMLSSAGWQFREQLVHYVYLVNPTMKLISLVKSETVARFLGKFFVLIRDGCCSEIDVKDYSLEEMRGINNNLALLWSDFRQKNMVTIDKGVQYLEWRYMQNPDKKYLVIKISKKSMVVGCIVYTYEYRNKVLTIYEVIASSEQFVKGILVAFIAYEKNEKDINSIRCPLNMSHPYSAEFSAIGFFRRENGNKVLSYCKDDLLSIPNTQWICTGGDKDI